MALKQDVTGVLKESLANMQLMNNVETQSVKASNNILSMFQQWLLDQAHKDSTNDFRNTRAYNLYQRLKDES